MSQLVPVSRRVKPRDRRTRGNRVSIEVLAYHALSRGPDFRGPEVWRSLNLGVAEPCAPGQVSPARVNDLTNRQAESISGRFERFPAPVPAGTRAFRDRSQVGRATRSGPSWGGLRRSPPEGLTRSCGGTHGRLLRLVGFDGSSIDPGGCGLVHRYGPDLTYSIAPVPGPRGLLHVD